MRYINLSSCLQTLWLREAGLREFVCLHAYVCVFVCVCAYVRVCVLTHHTPLLRSRNVINISTVNTCPARLYIHTLVCVGLC
jgi:hypothetical protein